MSRSSNSAREPKRLIEAAGPAMPEGAMMTRDQAQALVEKVVKMSKADEIIGQRQQRLSGRPSLRRESDVDVRWSNERANRRCRARSGRSMRSQ